MSIHFYCGLAERKWNYHPVQPGPFACISPVYGKTEQRRSETRVYVPVGVKVIQDSGAFCDGPKLRLSFCEALKRQETHADKFLYTGQITHRASYDLLIDEKWESGVRKKAKWSENDAEEAVKIIVDAAKYMSMHRNGVSLILSAQGVSVQQYLKCTEKIVSLMHNNDMFGLGGWCITGRLPKQMLPVFAETMNTIIPFAQREGVKRVHIWGVIFPKALTILLKLCDRHNIKLSTDSHGPSVNPCFGNWGYGSWRDKTYTRPPVEIRGLERARHVQCTSNWLFRYRESDDYGNCR